MAPRGEPRPLYGGVPHSCDVSLGGGRVRSLMATAPERSRRIRLVAYGARLESVLGESPRGFESPIIRTEERVLARGPVPAHRGWQPGDDGEHG